MEQEAHDLGLEILEADIRNVPQSARLHGMRGVILAQLSEFEQAEARLNSSVRQNRIPVKRPGESASVLPCSNRADTRNRSRF